MLLLQAPTRIAQQALDHPIDFKSALQERLAQRGETVTYTVTAEEGPPHERTFEVSAAIGERPVGAGRGRSKKAAEQEAARVALELLDTDADAAEELAEGEGVGSCT